MKDSEVIEAIDQELEELAPAFKQLPQLQRIKAAITLWRAGLLQHATTEGGKIKPAFDAEVDVG